MTNQPLPPIADFAAGVARGTASLARALERVEKTDPAELRAWLVENDPVVRRLIGEAATEPALRLSALEIAHAAALRAESAHFVLNYGLNLGHMLVFRTEDSARGLAILEQAVPQIKVVTLDTTDRVTTILVLADAYFASYEKTGPEHFTMARRAFEFAVRTAESDACRSDVAARAHVGLGRSLMQKAAGAPADYRAALGHFESALVLLQSREDEDLHAETLFYLGRCLSALPDAGPADYQRAAECLQDALKRSEQLGRDSWFLAVCENLAALEARLGHVMRAVALYERALERTHPVRDRLAFSQLQCRLAALCRGASLWSHTGRDEMVSLARASYVAAAEAADQDRDTDDWAAAVSGLSSMRNLDGHLEEAIALDEEVLARLQRPDLSRRRSLVAADCAQMLGLLGEKQALAGARADAERTRERARRARSQIDSDELAPHRVLFIDAHLNSLDAALAQPSERSAFDESTIDLLQRALATSHGIRETDEIREIERQLSVLYRRAGRWPELAALARNRLARDAAAVGAYSTLSDFITLTNGQKDYRDALVHAALMTGNVAAAEREAELARGRVLERIAAATAYRAGTSPLRSDHIPEALSTSHRELVRDWLGNLDTDDVDQGHRRHALGPWLRETFVQAAHWRGNWVVDAGEPADEPRDPVAVQAPATAVVQFWASKDNAGVFVRASGDAEAHFIALPRLVPDQQMRWMSEWFERYGDFEARGVPALKAFAAAMGHVVNDISSMCAPLFTQLAGLPVRRLIITQDHRLDSFPLHAMRLGDGRLLCDRYEVSFAPSIRLLNRASTRRAEPLQRVLFGGDPQRECASGTCGARCRLALGAAASELEAIRAAWPDVVALIGRECTPAAFLNAVERLRPEVIHLSVHGAMFYDDPLNSGVVLAYGGAPNDDPLSLYIGHRLQRIWGIDTAGEMLTLDALIRKADLRCCRLAVLNSCETGLSAFGAPGQAVSVGSGLLAAGVASVIAPLWPTDDFSAALLARRFYGELARRPGSILTALSRAQQWMRTLTMAEASTVAGPRQIKAGISLSGDAHPFSHVFFWGAYQLHGDPGPAALEEEA